MVRDSASPRDAEKPAKSGSAALALVAALPMSVLVAALAGGVASVLLRGMPLKLGVIVAIVIGILAGFVASRAMPETKGA